MSEQTEVDITPKVEDGKGETLLFVAVVTAAESTARLQAVFAHQHALMDWLDDRLITVFEGVTVTITRRWGKVSELDK